MTTMTFAPASTGGNDPIGRTAGYLDAHAEHGSGVSLDVIAARGAWCADYAPIGYALGYTAAWYELAIRQEQAVGVDTAWAYLERAEAM